VKAIKEERLRRGLSQTDVAKRLKVSQSSWVSKLEMGQHRIDIVEFYRLAKAIGFDPIKMLRKVYRENNGRR
jgi:transcriptional regulator with XRE-family HTH domain